MLPYLLYFSSRYFLLSYHTMSILCLTSLVMHLPAFACLCSRHGFQCMIRFYRYTCTHISTPSGFCLTTRWGSSDSSGSSCPGPGAWTVGYILAEDQVHFCGAVRSAVAPVPFLLPLLARGSSSYLVSALLYCSYIYISLYSRICAYQVM